MNSLITTSSLQPQIFRKGILNEDVSKERNLFSEMGEDRAPHWGSIWISTPSAESTLVLNSNNWSSACKEMESAYQSPSSTSSAINTII